MAPFCDGPNPGSHCFAQWCFVPKECTAGDLQKSTAFGVDDLYFSYMACGNEASFDDVVALTPMDCDATGGAGGDSNTGGTVINDEYNQLSLAAHNSYRMMHGADPLMYDEDLARDAQEWAQYLANKGLPLEHAQDIDEGENLAFSSFPNFATSADATDSWYNEVEFYDFENPGFSGATGHFTQVVWKGTEKLGCGIAGDFVVCRYSPSGNITNPGFFAANVMPKMA